MWALWALVGPRALVGPPWALVGPLGPMGSLGPCGGPSWVPWAFVGILDLVGPPWPLWAAWALVASHGRLWAPLGPCGHPLALMGWALMPPPLNL